MATLITRYRPKTLEEIAGNDEVKKSLQSIFEREEEKLPHVFLFVGPAGCGKSTLAMVVKNELGISDEDCREYDTANTRGIDTVREIGANVNYAPSNGSRKCIILEECHQITGVAQEGLLRSLENCPSHMFFILCTTEPEKLKDTLLRRCIKYEVKPLIKTKMINYLKSILEKENFDVAEYPIDILKKIADESKGSPGISLSLLDEILDMESTEDIINTIENITSRSSDVINIARILLENKTVDDKWKEIKSILKDMKGEPESVRYAILNYLNKVMLGDKGGKMIAAAMIPFTESVMYSGKAGITLACWYACNPE